MGDGAVHAGELAHHLEGGLPVLAEAAVFAGNDQREQAALAQGVALGLRRTATGIALGGGFGELRGQLPGAISRVRDYAWNLGGHAGILVDVWGLAEPVRVLIRTVVAPGALTRSKSCTNDRLYDFSAVATSWRGGCVAGANLLLVGCCWSNS
ncbi:hypothetical protein D9M69_589120 [compost metagenome]